MSIHEIVLPETKPETEWILGRAVQKTGGTRTHAILQGAFSVDLAKWANGRGEVGISWRFRVAPRARFVVRSRRTSRTYPTSAFAR